MTADTATPGLPDDVEGLRALLLATLAERDELVTQNDRLRHLLLKLKRLQFGAKSERLPEEQMQLALEDLEQAIAGGEAQAEKRDPGLRRDRVANRRASLRCMERRIASVVVAQPWITWPIAHPSSPDGSVCHHTAGLNLVVDWLTSCWQGHSKLFGQPLCSTVAENQPGLGD